MDYTADPRVDAYIDALPEWQQAVCRQVRELVHAADPDVVETIKTHPPALLRARGNVCALLAAKDHVNVFLYDGGLTPDPEHLITGGQGTRRAARWPSTRASRSTRPALTDMFRSIIANNRAGGWRKIKNDQ